MPRPKRKNATDLSYIEPALHTLAVPVDMLMADPENARHHSRRNLAAIKASLTRFGQQVPIVADRDGVVRKGNGTYAAAQSLGWTHIAALRTSLSAEEARAYAVADNRATDLSAFEDEALVSAIREIEKSEAVSLDAVGFTTDEAHDICAAVEQVEQEAKQLTETAATNEQRILSAMTGAVDEDAIFDSDNQFDIPTLRSDRIPTQLPKRTYAGGHANQRGEEYLFIHYNRRFPRWCQNGTLAFWCDDTLWEWVWTNRVAALQRFKEYEFGAVCAPEFSVLPGMPLAQKLWQRYRTLWTARWWQENGLYVIPPIWPSGKHWGTEMSNIAINCIPHAPNTASIQVQALGYPGEKMSQRTLLKRRRTYAKGIQETLEYIEPKSVLLYGARPGGWLDPYLDTNACKYTFCETFTQRRNAILAARKSARRVGSID